MINIAAIVPAYNEEQSIKNVILSINAIKSVYFKIKVIVINDCSKDNTIGIINSLDCISLNLPINLGIGGAVQTGFKYAVEHDFDFAIQVDGDGQHPENEIEKMYLSFRENTCDVVIGSRFILNNGFRSTLLLSLIHI